MTAPWRVRQVVPTGTRRAEGFACGPGLVLHEWQEATYPPSPAGERLRALRVELDVGLRQAARRLEMSARELSDLEAGRAVLADDGEWARARALIRAAALHLDMHAARACSAGGR